MLHQIQTLYSQGSRSFIPTEVPFDFNLESSAGDKLEVKFLLKISNSTTDFPLIVLLKKIFSI